MNIKLLEIIKTPRNRLKMRFRGIREEDDNIAWIDGKWLNDVERAEQLRIYDEYYREVIFPTYGDDPTNWPIEAVERWVAYSRLERISRCMGDLLEFAIEYFSEARNPGNPGNWDGFDLTKKEDAAEFHREITDMMNRVSNEDTNAKVAVAAPRGHAKSSYLSKAFPIHELLYRRRRYMLLISETPKVAKANLDWIRDQIKYNKKLREDFGELLSEKDKANIQDNNEGFIAWERDGESRRQVALLESASVGGSIRGRNWNGMRPDLIVLDDLEDARSGGNASTPEQRSQLRDWFTQSVIPLGDPKGKRTAFVYMGTTVHHEALLMYVLHDRADFESKIYRAIINEPERMDLWEECRQIYINRENKERYNDAKTFYERNKDEMDRGTKVLWEEGKSIWDLMTWKWDNGSKAFNTEYMNNPIDEDSMIFNPNTFTYWDDDHPSKEFSHNEYIISIGVDMALGKERGDYSAISVVAKHKENGTINVIDSYGERLKVDEFIEVVVEKVLEWEPDVVAVESVAAQEFFADTLKFELANAGYPSYTRLKKIFSRNRKELRIEAMKPLIENGTLQFSRKHQLLLEQFERYGQGGHDDLPDSLEMAISATNEGEPVVRTVKRMNRW